MKINRYIPNYLQQYTDCFCKIGCIKEKYHIVVDREVPPVMNPPRHITASLKIKLNMSGQVITATEETTDWVSSLVIVEKPNGQLRICLDPRHLNQAIKLPHFVMSTAKEILV